MSDKAFALLKPTKNVGAKVHSAASQNGQWQVVPPGPLGWQGVEGTVQWWEAYGSVYQLCPACVWLPRRTRLHLAGSRCSTTDNDHDRL